MECIDELKCKYCDAIGHYPYSIKGKKYFVKWSEKTKPIFSLRCHEAHCSKRNKQKKKDKSFDQYIQINRDKKWDFKVISVVE